MCDKLTTPFVLLLSVPGIYSQGSEDHQKVCCYLVLQARERPSLVSEFMCTESVYILLLENPQNTKLTFCVYLSQPSARVLHANLLIIIVYSIYYAPCIQEKYSL